MDIPFLFSDSLSSNITWTPTNIAEHAVTKNTTPDEMLATYPSIHTHTSQSITKVEKEWCGGAKGVVLGSDLPEKS